MILFPNGIQGLSDSKWAGVRGAANRLVGVDYRSEPGVIKAHQKLTKLSPSEGDNIVSELCKVALPLSDGSTLWFSSESGKIWREVSGTFTAIDPIQIFAYDLRTAADTGKTYTAGTEVNIPSKIQWKSDGTKMYVMCNSNQTGPGDGNSGYIFQYALSAPWDISTASYETNKFFAADIQAQGFYLKQDGTKFYISEGDGTFSVIEYDLSTAWDISTASASGDTYNFSTQGARSNGLFFKPDGTKMYISFIPTSTLEDHICEYDLSTAWDITTATFLQSFDTVDKLNFGFGGFDISPNGLTCITYSNESNTDGATLNEYRLGTAWDISTMVATGKTFLTGLNSEGGELLFAVSMFPDFSGFVAGDQGSVILNQYSLNAEDDTNVTILGAEEFGVPDGGVDQDEMTQYVYFAIKNWLLRVPISGVTDFDVNYEFLNRFLNGDDTYHPVKKANGRLYIGDKHTICEVNEAGVITLQSDFSIREPERITILENFDVDLLIGTKAFNGKSRILRWDTESPTWYGEDFMYEDEIHAFLDEDNYTYAIVGDFGQMHYYDGEKLLKFMRIPGSYSATSRVKVNANSIGYFMGVPVFGLTNIEGNAALQGVYSFGQYSKDYNITMDLSFPISSGEFSGLEIGAIIVQGTDLYVAWKSATATGIDKLDWSLKYNGAYIETMVLNNAEDRSRFKAFDKALADYIEMPENTDVNMAYSKNYGEYIDFETVPDDKLLQLRSKTSIPEIGAITLKFTFTTSANTTPRIENFHGDFEGEE